MTTEAQKNWLSQHPEFQPVGPPRPGVSFTICGTLYADGGFEPMAPMQTIRLEQGCVCVGILAGNEGRP